MSDVPLRQVAMQPYRLPLTAPWRTARGTLTDRRGWLLRIRDAEGWCGFGECAPLPAAGTESFARAGSALTAWCATLRGRRPDEALAALDPEADTPAVRCAVESALMDLVARRAGLPLRCWLVPDCGATPAVNGQLGVADAALPDRCAAALDAGFSVLKVKLGVGTRSAEREALERAVASLPADARLRLDANGAWDAAAARDWLGWLAGMPIESLEEPVSQPEPGTLRDLQQKASFALALDESAPAMLASVGAGGWPVRRVVLKPMALGGAGPTLAIAGRLAAAGVEIVITTALEAAPGRWLCAHLAAACGSSRAHGLDTGRWLAADLGAGPAVATGICRLGDAPGLGFETI